MKIVVVAPVYNEAETIPELYKRLAATLDGQGAEWELILVNDGSSDETWQVVRDLHAGDQRVKGVSLARNFGQQAALTAGLRHAEERMSSSDDTCVLMDADLQDPPEFLPEMIARLAEGYDVVYAVKRSRRESFLRGTLFNLFHQIQTRLVNPPMPRGAGTFSALRRAVVRAINSMPERSRYLPGLRAYAGFRQTGMEFDRPERFAGAPKQTFGKLLRMGLDAIFAYSFVPARIASVLGLLTAAVALVFTAWVLWQKWFTGKAILGWASTMVSHLFLGAVQLICIGILGEYVARIYEEVRARPIYLIAEQVGLGEDQTSRPQAPMVEETPEAQD
ncbi:MAG: glycosyltransferase family 2 protein [Armatimonadetes bacterium]|nr:glycosyltransferase family 2 protein [Armatimonadota bacterium]